MYSGEEQSPASGTILIPLSHSWDNVLEWTKWILCDTGFCFHKKIKSWVLKVMDTWIGWEVVSGARLFVQGCKPMVQTWKEVANVLFDEQCHFLAVLNVYLLWTACLVLMLSNAHLLISVQLPCCSRVYALSFTS